MNGYADSELADAFNFYLPQEFAQITALLRSRNSHHASKNPNAPKPHKH